MAHLKKKKTTPQHYWLLACLVNPAISSVETVFHGLRSARLIFVPFKGSFTLLRFPRASAADGCVAPQR